MIEMIATVQDHFESVLKAAEKARVRSLNHAAGSLRKRAIASITPSREAAPPGHPPHTRRGLFRRAIRYYVDPHGEFAVIGPDASVAGESGQAHEFGGTFRQREYPQRPFMRPAMEATLEKFGAEWAGAIGEP
jgi:hypothetical protein